MLLPNYQVRTFQENCIWFLYHLLVGTFYEVSPVLSSCYVLFQKMILDTSGAGAKAEVLTAVPLLLDMGHSRLGFFCPRMKSVPILIDSHKVAFPNAVG